MASREEFRVVFEQCERSANHLELRSEYFEDLPKLRQWQEGIRPDPSDRATWWTPWLDVVSNAVARGVQIRRARIVSEPVSEYIRWEHATTWRNIEAGEDVRWLPRRNASQLLVPVSDFWVLDERIVATAYHDGDGRFLDIEMNENPAEATMYSQAFEAVWSRALRHEDYAPI